ncbi:FAD:protein FMN transferase [Stieleria marina]|uniref:FAD:protein FMN transferase n=1 Tax=Stieleria marina TaxID=1930275 RepID=A0A517NSP7_9BACT|nr:Thiamine biosynthesis lipoprotein ApbE precursor [Planctomycetes bacterium K23_9]
MTNSRTRRTVLFVAFFLALTAHVSDAFAQAPLRTFRGQTMGTTYMVKIFGSSDVDDDIRIAIDAELRQVNDQMSTYLKTSELSRFNASLSTDWFDVSSDTASVVAFAQEVAKKTNGAFDVTVGPLVNAWGFGPGERTGKAPDQSVLDELQKSIGYQHLQVRLDPPALKKSVATLKVDLSAIAKGHGVDRIVALLAKAGATDVFVEIGGEVRVSGSKTGKPWTVGIQLPDADAVTPMIAHPLSISEDESMATSGDYRNFFVDEEKRYSHTIDPRTAKPISHTLASVSVVTESCMMADAWATAINVLGPDDGLELAKSELISVLLINRNEGKYERMGTGTLAQYATEKASITGEAAMALGQQNALPTILLSAVVMALIVMAMAVGVIFGRKSISGSCGGLANKQNEDGSSSCALCSNPSDACQELREKMAK